MKMRGTVMPLFYLKTLVIQNFATFKNQSIQFEEGLNAIVGETGSGKSLVLEAIELILGGRADKKIVRRDTDTACIEARFICHDPKVINFFHEEGYLIEDDEIVIKRLISKSGCTKNYINHQSCTVSLLANFAKTFIDVVGQFDNQKLLSDQYQLALIDQFAKTDEQLDSYKLQLERYKALERKLIDLQNTQAHRDQRLDYLNFQLDEINRLNPSSQDEEELLRKKNIFLNLEKSQRISAQINEIFEGGEGTLGLESLTSTLSHLVLKNHDLLQEFSEKVVILSEEIREMHHALATKLEQEIDISEFDQVIERLDLYQKLKRKFSGTVEGILQAQVDFLKEKNHLDELDINLQDILLEKEKIYRDLITLASQLHQERLKAAPRLAKELTKKIRALNMTGATIDIKTEELEELTDSGKTKIYFLAETNKGEGYYKIKDIASGGELSRILLGLRQVLSKYDSIGVFLFDEIDTGIGGETALTIGKALLEVALQGQVIAITHLPQIAQFAANLIVVEKHMHESKKETRTESLVKMVKGESIYKEVKAMIQLQ